MAETKNAGSRFLAAAFPRLLTASGADIIITQSAPNFHYNSAGVADVASITFTAQLLALDGIVQWSCDLGTLTNISGNSATLLASNMNSNVATITATLVYRGVSFIRTTKVTKVYDGSSANSVSNAVVYAYQRKATAPTASPGDIIYDFAIGGITFPATLANGWFKAIPTGTDPLYVTTSSASNSAGTDSIASNEWSTPVVLARDGANGTQGLNVATVYIYQRTATNNVPALPGQSTTYTFVPAGLTGLTNGWSSAIPASSMGGYLWVSTSTATSYTNTDTILSSEWATAQLLSQDGQGAGTPGQNGNSTGTVTLYQWSTVVPANPTGTATFTWNMAATTAYSGSDGWYITAPSNPGGPGVKLFIASVPVTAPYGTASTTTTFGSAQIFALSQNGATGTQGVPGLKTASVYAYQWALSAPTVTGTATYTWLAGTYNTPPSTGWTIVKGNAPGTGYTLYEATVRLTESTGAATSNIDWTLATISGIAYQGASGGAGSQGASARRAYVLVDGNSLSGTPTTLTMPGQALPTTGTWGETRAWQSTAPAYTAGQSVFQADGVFDPVPNQTVWNVPYLSALKVGSLSAISANLGAVTAGSIDLGTGALSWHIDTGGNQWAGAATYAAAPFRVSNSGNVVMKSFILQNSNGDTILTGNGSFSGDVAGTINGTAASTVVTNASTALSAVGIISSDNWLSKGEKPAVIRQFSVIDAERAGIAKQATDLGISAATYQGTIDVLASFLVNNVGPAVGDWSNLNVDSPIDGAYMTARFTDVGRERQKLLDAVAAKLQANTTSVGVIANNANNAIPGLNSSIADKLSKSANSTLTGTIALATQYAIQVGNANDGLFMGSTGLYGRKGGVTTFAVQNDGTAIFNGQLAAGSVTTSMLTVGNPDNIIPDPKFKDLVWWNRVGFPVGDYTGQNNGWLGGAILLLPATGGTTRSSTSRAFTTTPGATMRLEVQVELSNDFVGEFSVYFYVEGASLYSMGCPNLGAWPSGDYPGWPIQFNSGSAKGRASFSQEITIPVNSQCANAHMVIVDRVVSGNVAIGSCVATRVSDNVLIKNGAITADKISVNNLQAISSVVIARVGGTGAGVDMDVNGARTYDGNGVRRFQWGNLDV